MEADKETNNYREGRANLYEQFYKQDENLPGAEAEDSMSHSISAGGGKRSQKRQKAEKNSAGHVDQISASGILGSSSIMVSNHEGTCESGEFVSEKWAFQADLSSNNYFSNGVSPE